MSDLRQRVPGHSLIDELLHQWDLGTIHVGSTSDEIVIDDEAVSWYRGVIGERRVATLLTQLGPDWTVLHSVPVGSGTTDIDHIAIGPPGVFTINTKYSPGKDVWVAGTNLQVGGHAQRHVHNSIREMIRASAALARATQLDVPVTGVIAFVDPRHITLRARPGSDGRDVRVVSDRDLLATLRGPTMLMPHELERVVDAAIRPETWHDFPASSTVGNHIEREFSALEEAVGPRLAEPVNPSTKPARAPQRAKPRTTSSRPARTSSGSARAKASRPTRSSSSRTRPQRSPLGRVIERLIGPVVALGVFWVLLQYLTNR